MNRLLNFWNGYKTYLGFAAGLGYLVAIDQFGVPSNEVLWGLIVTWTGVSFRKAMDK